MLGGGGDDVGFKSKGWRGRLLGVVTCCYIHVHFFRLWSTVEYPSFFLWTIT